MHEIGASKPPIAPNSVLKTPTAVVSRKPYRRSYVPIESSSDDEVARSQRSSSGSNRTRRRRKKKNSPVNDQLSTTTQSEKHLEASPRVKIRLEKSTTELLATTGNTSDIDRVARENQAWASMQQRRSRLFELKRNFMQNQEQTYSSDHLSEKQNKAYLIFVDMFQEGLN